MRDTTPGYVKYMQYQDIVKANGNDSLPSEGFRKVMGKGIQILGWVSTAIIACVIMAFLYSFYLGIMSGNALVIGIFISITILITLLIIFHKKIKKVTTEVKPANYTSKKQFNIQTIILTIVGIITSVSVLILGIAIGEVYIIVIAIVIFAIFISASQQTTKAKKEKFTTK
jgi:hypothetical protein